MRAKHRMDTTVGILSMRDVHHSLYAMGITGWCADAFACFCMIAITHAVHTTLDPSLMLVEAVDAILADARRLLRQLAQNLARVAIMRPRAALPSLSRVLAQAL